MMQNKLQEYEGVSGRFNKVKQNFRERYSQFREDGADKLSWRPYLRAKIQGCELEVEPQERLNEKTNYGDIFRRKTQLELLRISAAVMGIEFCYAAETAFVSPILLEIGIRHQNMSLVWALSPLIGFLLTPLLGSLSDRCRLSYGRRRPFIVLMSIGILIGLILVPNGSTLGIYFGDTPSPNNDTYIQFEYDTKERNTGSSIHYHWGMLLTIMGTVFLDFNADACQSPARAYLLDVTIADDHARGLSSFTVMAGLGGSMGYALGGIDWDSTIIGDLFGGHIRAVFSLITVIFIFCVITTITSFEEIPLDEILEDQLLEEMDGHVDMEATPGTSTTDCPTAPSIPRAFTAPCLPSTPTSLSNGGFVGRNDVNNYGSVKEIPIPATSEQGTHKEELQLIDYLRSIINLPNSLRLICATNLFCWMAHVCYSLYFTDFVGEAVFGGDPSAPLYSVRRDLYEQGLRFGCFGMSMYSLTCSIYSTVIEKLIKKFGAKKIYISGICSYSIGMWLIWLLRTKTVVIVFSCTAGIMYATLFTLPYILVANYHTGGKWDVDGGNEYKRGLGTDIAVVGSCVFVAQIFVSMVAGSAVRLTGTTSTIVALAALLASVAIYFANKIVYLDL